MTPSFFFNDDWRHHHRHHYPLPNQVQIPKTLSWSTWNKRKCVRKNECRWRQPVTSEWWQIPSSNHHISLNCQWRGFLTKMGYLSEVQDQFLNCVTIWILVWYLNSELNTIPVIEWFQMKCMYRQSSVKNTY